MNDWPYSKSGDEADDAASDDPQNDAVICWTGAEPIAKPATGVFEERDFFLFAAAHQRRLRDGHSRSGTSHDSRRGTEALDKRRSKREREEDGHDVTVDVLSV